MASMSPKFKCDVCSAVVKRKQYLFIHIRARHQEHRIRAFKCQQCDAHFFTNEGLKAHFGAIHDGTKFDCDTCGQIFAYRSGLTSHMAVVHRPSPLASMSPKFKCDVCSAVVKRKEFLVIHIRARHQEHRIRDFECQLCKIDFYTERGLKGHNSVIHEGARFQCDTCEKLYGQKSQLTTHIAFVHRRERRFECVACEAKFTTNEHLKTHTATKHHQLRWECDDCDDKFKQKVALTGHIGAVHNKQPLLECVECGDKFPKYYLKLHKRRVHEKITFTCDVCSQSFTSMISLSIHIRVQHEHIIGAFKCHLCGVNFGSKSGLLYHREVFHEETKYQCDTCGKQCGLKHSLIKHITFLHQQQPLFECNVCGAKVIHLQKHMARIHDPKQEQCDDCGAVYGLKRDLRNHIRSSHLKRCVFSCAKCQAKFSSKSKLHGHMGSVHEKPVYTCDVCSKTFIRKGHVANHYVCFHK